MLGAVAPPFTIDIGPESGPILGGVPIPIFEVLFGSIFVYLVHRFYKSFRFGFVKSFPKTMWVFFPVLVTIIVNIITSTSLKVLFSELPIGQLFISVVFSFIGALIVGFFEEILMRGAMFNLFMNTFKQSKHCVLLSATLSSLLFGLTHLGNLSSGANLTYTIYQVFYAAAMGFLFCMAYVKYQSLLIPIGMHVSIDFFDFLFNISGEPSMNSIQWVPITLIIVFLFCGIGLYKTIDTTSNSLGFQE